MWILDRQRDTLIAPTGRRFCRKIDARLGGRLALLIKWDAIENIRFLIGIFILQKTRQRFWLSSAIAGQPDVAAAFGLRV